MAKNNHPKHQLAELLNNQRKEAIGTDVVLVCKGKELPAHKMILSATSNYFQAMFSSGWNDIQNNRINFPTIRAEEMDIILSFLYLGEFECVEDHDLLVAILKVSHFLQIETLFECSYERISDRMNCSNFLDVINLCFQYDNEGMIMRIVTFLARNFEDIAGSEEFLELNACQVEKICQHPDILKSSMDIVIRALLRWTEVVEDREKSLLKILTILDLHRLSTVFLSEILRECTIVKKNCHILTLLTAEATSRMLTLSLSNAENQNKPKILTFGKKNQTQIFRTYDVQKNEWSSIQIIPFHLSHSACTVWFDGFIYIFGGLKNGGEETSEKKGSDTDDESSEENMNEDNESEEPSARIIKYCPANNTVASFGMLTIPVHYAGTGVLEEYIYIVSGGNALPTVQCYDPVTGTCEPVSPCRKRRHWPRVLPYGKYLFVLESRDGRRSIERYNPKYDEWVIITAVPELIDWCSAAICEHKLFVLPEISTVEFQIYDLISGTWEQTQLKRSPRKIHDLYSIRFQGKSILFVRDKKNILHSYDPISKKCFSKSAPNEEPWGKCCFWTTYVTKFA